MTFFALPGRTCGEPLAWAASRLGRLKPPPRTVSAPAVRVSRRVSPSQQRRGLPSIVNMVQALILQNTLGARHHHPMVTPGVDRGKQRITSGAAAARGRG